MQELIILLLLLSGAQAQTGGVGGGTAGAIGGTTGVATGGTTTTGYSGGFPSVSPIPSVTPMQPGVTTGVPPTYVPGTPPVLPR